MANHDGNHRSLVEKNVPIALILPRKWEDAAEDGNRQFRSVVDDRCSTVDDWWLTSGA